MTKAKNIIDYDKDKAKRWFAFLKILEVLGVFLLTFGLYGLGIVTSSILLAKDYVYVYGYWVLGLLLILLIILILAILLVIGLLAYLVVKEYLKLNWKWAKLIAENPAGKKKRLAKEKAERIAEDNEIRKEYGFCIGDEVEIKKCKVGKIYGGCKFKKKMVKHIGERYDVYKQDDEGDFLLDYSDNEGNDYVWSKDMLKLIKKRIEK